MVSRRQHLARERLVMRKTPFGKRRKRYDMILGFFPGKIPGSQSSKGKVLTVASYPAVQRCLVGKKLARLWWQRLHQDQARSTGTLRRGGQSKYASKCRTS